MLTPNTTLQGRYRIIRQLGQGGMGAVYEAFDERLDAMVALKETFFTDERLRRAFEREARLLAKLRHPALTRVIDHFTENEGQFLVMDFVAGEDLGQMLQQGAGGFPVERVLDWADQLLDALAYLHGQQPPVVHRDIKPQNLKLTGDGRIILLDFGLAKGHQSQGTTITTTKSVLGYSLSYAPLEQLLQVESHWVDLLSMSNPEEVRQLLDRGTDSRSDLYALGATLFHLLTGKAPANAPTRALAVWSNRPDPLEAGFGNRAPPAVAAAIARALALDPEKRFRDASEMRKALRGEPSLSQPLAAARAEPDEETLAVTRLDSAEEARARARHPQSQNLPPTVAWSAGPIVEPVVSSSQQGAATPAPTSPAPGMSSALPAPNPRPPTTPAQPSARVAAGVQWLIAAALGFVIIIIALTITLSPYRNINANRAGIASTNATNQSMRGGSTNATGSYPSGTAIVIGEVKQGFNSRNRRDITPVPRTSVVLQGRDRMEGYQATTITDATGKFRFENVPPGYYVVRANGPNMVWWVTDQFYVQTGRVVTTNVNID